jgi:hypothetical protein
VTRSHVAVILNTELWARAGGDPYRKLGVECSGDPLPDWLFTQGVELVVDHCSPALIAVEAESGTDVRHRGIHAFLAATEVATVPDRRTVGHFGSGSCGAPVPEVSPTLQSGRISAEGWTILANIGSGSSATSAGGSRPNERHSV